MTRATRLLTAIGAIVAATFGVFALETADTSETAVASPSPVWAEQGPAESPPAENGGAIGYDPVTKSVVLFGGFAGSGDTGQTWTWDGTTWTQQHPVTSPPPQDGAEMAFDPANNGMVLFSGSSFGSFTTGTWIWDGTNWTQAHPTTNPPYRVGGVMAYDEANGDDVLFGGWEGSSATTNTDYGYGYDTWTWDGSNWTEQNPTTHPPGRLDASIAYDPARSDVVLFGGVNESGGSNGLNDTWTWDGSNWTQTIPSNSPSPRWGGTMAFSPASANLILLGGAPGPALGDTWAWDGSTWTQLAEPVSPSPRDLASAAADPANGTLVLFGGEVLGGTRYDDTWTYGDLGPVPTDASFTVSPTSITPGLPITVSSVTPCTMPIGIVGFTPSARVSVSEAGTVLETQTYSVGASGSWSGLMPEAQFAPGQIQLVAQCMASAQATSSVFAYEPVILTVKSQTQQIPEVTSPHTGEPWAGSGLMTVALAGVGGGFLALGLASRRRRRTD